MIISVCLETLGPGIYLDVTCTTCQNTATDPAMAKRYSPQQENTPCCTLRGIQEMHWETAQSKIKLHWAKFMDFIYQLALYWNIQILQCKEGKNGKGKKISTLRWESERREEKKHSDQKKIQIMREKSHHFDRQMMGYHINAPRVEFKCLVHHGKSPGSLSLYKHD